MSADLRRQFAFVNLRILVGIVFCSTGMLLALLASRPSPIEQPNVAHKSGPVAGSLSPLNVDLRVLAQVPVQNVRRPELEAPTDYKQFLPEALLPEPEEPNTPHAPMPGPLQNFAGLSATDNCVGGQCGSGIPPDTNGDVGSNHYIQAVNKAFGVFSKTGQRLASFTEGQLWVNSGCSNPQGDPVVLYDSIADRWILTAMGSAVDSGGNSVSPFYQCIAVSITNNPVSGGWYRYAFRMDTGVANQPPVNTLNDYPKFGVWTDCLYYSANGYNASTLNYTGGIWGTFPLKDMYAGQSVVTMGLGYVASSNDYFTMIPSNLSGPAGALPPLGRLNFYVQESRTQFNFRVRTVTPGSNCGGGGTLSAATVVGQSSYSVPLDNIVPQPPPATSSNNLDSLGDQMMQKVQYRRVGSTESLWVTHTFRSSIAGPTGSQWAQINVTGGGIGTTPLQQQKYDPADGVYRWMSSIAADKDGNVALGYSTSSATAPNFPSIAYSGRLANDTPNMLPQSENQLIAGHGSQINNCGDPPAPCIRWGDYSSMSVDPDGCSFWYTSQYYVNQTNADNGAWNTRIGSFRFPTCGLFTKSDFNHDGSSDIIWQNIATGQRTIWLMNRTSYAGETGLPGDSTAWEVGGTGDFDRDGNVDVVWSNKNTGQRTMWLMNGINYDREVALPSGSAAWEIGGTGDFDRDGNLDLVWFNKDTGQRTMWLMKGVNYDREVNLPNGSVAWKIGGTGDFDRDGNVDIVWYNNSTGQRTIWLMNRTSYDRESGLPTGSAAWEIGGAGDFDGDGQADILWQNSTTGEHTIWLMNGTNYGREAGLLTTSAAWKIRNH